MRRQVFNAQHENNNLDLKYAGFLSWREVVCSPVFSAGKGENIAPLFMVESLIM